MHVLLNSMLLVQVSLIKPLAKLCERATSLTRRHGSLDHPRAFLERQRTRTALGQSSVAYLQGSWKVLWLLLWNPVS